MELAKFIDHTNLKANTTEADIKKTCQEAKQYGFRSVCINPRWVKLAKEELKDAYVKVITVIDWPCGASPTEVRLFQVKKAKEDGADEIDPVMDIGNFKQGNYEKVLEDLKALAEILPSKVIIESGFLTEEEIIRATQLVEKSGSICVKTSTGVPPKVDIDKKVEHVKIMRKAAGPKFLIKAAGGIRTLKDIKIMLEAGANIIGTSSGVAVMEEKEKALLL